MERLHFFAAVWPAGCSGWILLCREDLEVDAQAKLEAWLEQRPEGSRGYHMVGHCDADLGAAKLVKELRRVPAMSSPVYRFALERFARRVCRANAAAPAAHFELVGGELVPVRETVH